MANPHRGEVAFEAGGQAYVLCYNTNAICELEDKLNRSFTAIIKELGVPEDIKLSTLRAFFWAGLQERQPNITLKDAGSLMLDVGGGGKALELAMEAFTKAFPAPETKGAPPIEGQLPAQKANGTGQNYLTHG